MYILPLGPKNIFFSLAIVTLSLKLDTPARISTASISLNPDADAVLIPAIAAVIVAIPAPNATLVPDEKSRVDAAPTGVPSRLI